MMLRRQDMRLHFFERLHKLQDLCCSGKVARGSPRHTELLALEALESLYVQREMKRAGQVELRLAERTGQKMACVNY
jgi:hypothetical protein